MTTPDSLHRWNKLFKEGRKSDSARASIVSRWISEFVFDDHQFKLTCLNVENGASGPIPATKGGAYFMMKEECPGKRLLEASQRVVLLARAVMFTTPPVSNSTSYDSVGSTVDR